MSQGYRVRHQLARAYDYRFARRDPAPQIPFAPAPHPAWADVAVGIVCALAAVVAALALGVWA